MSRHHAVTWGLRGAICLAIPSFAFSNYDNYRDIRWLGRGNTGIALVNDGSAAFYNPGGIGAIRNYSFTLANPVLAGNQNFVSSFQNLSTLTSGSSSLTSKFSPFLGKPLGLQASAYPNIAVPGFVGGFWDYFDTQLEYRNPVNPQLEVSARNDYGLILGAGKGFNDRLFVGASVRYVRRKVVDTVISGSTLLTASASYLTNLLRNGEGWGFNVGAQYRLPLSASQTFSLGLTVEDLGRTRFVDQKGGAFPDIQDQKINAGMAYSFRSPVLDGSLLVDVKSLTNSEISTTKKLFTGAEVSLLRMDIRGGFFQGYWTAGLSLRLLPFLDLDFATYAEELDTAAGMRQNRMWLIGMNMGLELQKTAKRRQRFDLSGIK